MWKRDFGKIKTDKNKYNKYIRKEYLVLLLLACCLVGMLAAKYIRTFDSRINQADATEFYFSTDLTGDPTMVSETGESGYNFEDVQNGTWTLYGGGEHEIEINVRNYYDELRVMDQDITYKTEVTSVPADGGNTYDVSKVEFKTAETPSESEYTLGKDTQKDHKWTLKIPSYNSSAYDDGTVVKVTIQSTSPYVRTMELNFELYSVDTSLKYEVKDSPGSLYAELVIMTNLITTNEGESQNDTVQPTIIWPEDLSIDNTNDLTFTDAPDFKQQAGMTDRRMKTSQSLKVGRSESIYFFKTDKNKNYSTDGTVVVTPVSGTYSIELKEK